MLKNVSEISRCGLKIFHFEPNNKVASFKWYVFQLRYVHTLNKKKCFFRKSIIVKYLSKGRLGDLVGEKCTFSGQTEISGRWGGQKVQKSAGWPISAMLHTPLQGILISIEKKSSYVSWPKLCNAIKIKNHGWNPPCGTQCPYSPGLSLNEKVAFKQKWYV